MAVEQFRARSGTEIVDAAFQLTKANYAPLITIAAIGAVPGILSALVTPANPTQSGLSVLAGVLGLVQLILFYFMQTALFRAASDAYLGRPIDVGAAFRAAGSPTWRLFLVTLGGGILTFLGFILLIIPGFIVMAWFYIAPAITVLEGLDMSASLTRSRELVRGRVLAVLGSLLVFFLAFVVIGAIGGIISVAGATRVGPVIFNILSLFVWPLYGALVIVNYYDARIRKEGYDIELMAQSVPSSTVAGAPIAATAPMTPPPTSA